MQFYKREKIIFNEKLVLIYGIHSPIKHSFILGAGDLIHLMLRKN